MRTQPNASDEVDPLGPALVDAGIITADALATAQAEAAATEEPLARVIVRLGLASETDLVVATAQRLGHIYVDLSEYPVDLQAATLLTETMVRRYQAIPIDWDGARLVVAMVNPSDLFSVDDIRIITGAELQLMVTTASGLEQALSKYFGLDQETATLLREAEADQAQTTQPATEDIVGDAPIVRLVNVLIAQALADRASDIHLEPTIHDVRVRYRIDGVLHEVKRLPKVMQPALISRVKIMAELDIAERRLPQDGRVKSVFGGRTAELRVSVLPTVLGEQVTIRTLEQSQALLSLDQLGFHPDVAERYRKVVQRPNGTILVTGPTGSGKTTTLYATLNALNVESRKIITVEDPVEYQLPGIAQIQVNPKSGLTFSQALRSILRSDPDILLVGEIRDAETARTAIEAALTGHLVLSTLHTNDASSTPSRLTEMGAEAYLVGTALDGIIAQRLARRLCEKCRQPVAPTESDIEILHEFGREQPDQLMRPVGCSACSRTGYFGRIALHELLVVTEEVERLISDKAPSDEIRHVATEQGMRSLRQAGLEHVRTGVTSLEEILRVVV